jgi:pyrophosphatase PpaX
MTEPRFRSVLFDLDGTVIDSVGLILASHRHAAMTVLGSCPPDDVLRRGVGAHLATQMATLDADRVDELLAAYRAHNDAAHDDHVRAFEGIVDLVAALRAAGAQVGIVTSKRRATAERAFRLVPIEPLLDVVVTSDDTTEHKPHPAPLRLALDRLGRRPEDACYVGDSEFDMASARAAGVHAIGVTWGAATEEQLRGAGAEAIVTTRAELEDLLLDG